MNKKAFTLIELIVWITISMVLMVSVGVFVSSWMQNIFSQQEVLENTDDFTYFSNKLQTSFNLIQSWSFAPESTASWIIFKRWQSYWNGGFSYIWTETLSWVYCGSDSENEYTKNIYIKNFIPFEEQSENIFNDYDLILKSKLEWQYQSFQKEHIIKRSWNIVVWKWIFWDKFTEWVDWTDIYLNSPTGLSKSWSILFISDTLNNRILWYNTSNSSIHKLLDESDWLNEPTGLHYEDSEKALYIANSGNWEILKYSSKKEATNPILTMSWFSENINEIEISFSWNTIPNITNTWDWSITLNSTTPNYLTWTTDSLKYYFITKNSESIELSCTWTETKFNDWKPSIYCTKTWSWETANYPNSTISEISISNLNWFSATWSYYVNLKLFDWTNEKYSEYFPYFTQSDDDLTTPEDNTLEVVYSWLNYPTWLWWTLNSDFNEFWYWTYSTLPYHSSDTLLKTPIKELSITNTSNDLLSFVLKYYKKYNCYNLDDTSERTFIMKKNLK